MTAFIGKLDNPDTNPQTIDLPIRSPKKGKVEGREVQNQISTKEKLYKALNYTALALGVIAAVAITLAFYAFPPAGLAFTACMAVYGASAIGVVTSITKAMSTRDETWPLKAKMHRLKAESLSKDLIVDYRSSSVTELQELLDKSKGLYRQINENIESFKKNANCINPHKEAMQHLKYRSKQFIEDLEKETTVATIKNAEGLTDVPYGCSEMSRLVFEYYNTSQS